MIEFTTKQLKSHYEYLARTRLSSAIIQRIRLGGKDNNINETALGCYEMNFWSSSQEDLWRILALMCKYSILYNVRLLAESQQLSFIHKVLNFLNYELHMLFEFYSSVQQSSYNKSNKLKFNKFKSFDSNKPTTIWTFWWWCMYVNVLPFCIIWNIRGTL